MEEILNKAQKHMQETNTPFAVLIKRDTFDTYKMKRVAEPHLPLEMTREKAIELVLRHINDDDIVVSTTGMPSREVFEIRSRSKGGHHRDFLTVGSMGHASSIAAGIALQKPNRSVYCIDGDGAAIMHLGSLAVNGGLAAVKAVGDGAEECAPLLSNFKHVVVNNGAHDSVGGQPTVGFDVSLTDVAKACGYKVVRSEPVLTPADALAALDELRTVQGPAFLEIIVKKGNRKDLGRPTTTPLQNKLAFQEFVQKEASKL
jgi:phosphonopyruvate decarboxylase